MHGFTGETCGEGAGSTRPPSEDADRPGVARKAEPSLPELRESETKSRYRALLAGAGRGVPEAPARPGEIAWAQVAADLGLDAHSLHSPRSMVRRVVVELAEELGLSIHVPGRTCATTLAEFKKLLPIHRDRELRARGLDKKRRRKDAHNDAWGLNQIEADATMPARDAIEAALERLVEARSEGDRKLRSLYRGFLALLDRIEGGCLPGEFGEALRLACARVGLRPADIAEIVGAKPAAVANWLRRSKQPTPVHQPGIRRLEARLGLPENALWSRVRVRRAAAMLPGKDLDRTALGLGVGGFRHLRRLLPSDFDELDAGARESALQQALEHRSATASRQELLMPALQHQAYAVHDWPPHAEEEWNDLAQFVTDALPKRGDRRDGIAWSDATLRIVRTRVSQFFGYLSRMGEPGERVDEAHLTLALLVFADLELDAMRFRERRLREANGGEEPGLSVFDIGQLHLFRRLMHPDRGWLPQRPALAERLVPVPGRVSVEAVRAARQDWTGACALAWQRYQELAQGSEKRTTGMPNRVHAEERWRRDHCVEVNPAHANVLPILMLPDPLVAFSMLGQGLQHCLGETAPGSRAEALAQRNVVAAQLLSQFALREATCIVLDWRPGNAGHLRDVGGRWRLRIPAGMFKNYQSSVWSGGDFDRPLKDRWGLYDAIEGYLSTGRKILARGMSTDALLVSQPIQAAHKHAAEGAGRPARMRPLSEEPARFCSGSLSPAMKVVTAQHLGYRPHQGVGIEGIRAFGTSGFRHILATGMLKSSGELKLAADAIHDTPKMVKEHYGWYVLSERQEPSAEAVEGALTAADRKFAESARALLDPFSR